MAGGDCNYSGFNNNNNNNMAGGDCNYSGFNKDDDHFNKEKNHKV